MDNIIISKNGMFFVTDETMYSVAEDKSFNINEVTTEKWLDIFNQNTQFCIKNNILEIKELASYNRKITYQILEELSPSNKYNLMMEYEGKFGNLLLVENNVLIENIFTDAWDWTKKKLSEFGGFAVKAGKDMVDCVKGGGCNPFFEDIRTMLFNPVGIGVEIFLTATGIGAVPVLAVWGLLLVYDIYLLVNGDSSSSWWNILFDLLGVMGTGVLAKSIKGTTSTLKTGKNASEFVETASKNPKVMGILEKVYNSNVMKFINNVLGFVRKILDKLGLKKIINGIEWVSKKIAELLNAIGVKVGKSKLVSKSTGKQLVRKDAIKRANIAALQKGTSSGISNAAIAGGVAAGVDYFGGTKGEDEILKSLDNTNTEYVDGRDY